MPYFEEGSSIRNISFGTLDWYINDYTAEKGNIYVEDGVTIKFDFDTANDDDCIEAYRIRLRDKETNELVHFHTRDIQAKHKLKEYTYYSSRYYTAQVYDWLPFESVAIKKDELVEGKTYIVEVYAIDAFHVESETPIKAEVVYTSPYGA